MKIQLNGVETDITDPNLAAALQELGYGGAAVATAVNETFVPAIRRTTHILANGDRVEVVAPKQGG